ncbi:MAG TPA: leucyl/phenylalanyl-tRNA--protein transferase [Hyphomicrobiales bacterium]|nr:leucyl/phenylalanyl-tRNA--protein transferase [Hyphomicrobiales bacterium]
MHAPVPRQEEPQFHEELAAKARRWGLGTAYALRARRIALLPEVLGLTARAALGDRSAQPAMPPRGRFRRGGLVGAGGSLDPEFMLDAYRSGMFPFCHIGPSKWWSPDVRAVLRPEEAHIESNLRRLIRKARYRVTFDHDFAAVMRSCAVPREGRPPLTWVTPRVMRAFWRLHRLGHAHSVEVWDETGDLVGGLYGLAAGDVFFGESQFSFVRDASKIAVATLHCHLAHWGFVLRDAKFPTPHLTSLGFHEMPRDEFLAILRRHAWEPKRVGRWSVEPELSVADWRPAVRPAAAA